MTEPIDKKTPSVAPAPEPTSGTAVPTAAAPEADPPRPTQARAYDAVTSVFIPEEDLGELPSGYGVPELALLVRDPRTLFAYWFFDYERPHTGVTLVLRTLAGAEWISVREYGVTHEEPSFYLRGLEPGTPYRIEIVEWRPEGPAVLGRSLPVVTPREDPAAFASTERLHIDRTRPLAAQPGLPPVQTLHHVMSGGIAQSAEIEAILVPPAPAPEPVAEAAAEPGAPPEPTRDWPVTTPAAAEPPQPGAIPLELLPRPAWGPGASWPVTEWSVLWGPGPGAPWRQDWASGAGMARFARG